MDDKYTVLVVIVEDTNEALEAVSRTVEQIEWVKDQIGWEEAEELQDQLANFGRFV